MSLATYLRLHANMGFAFFLHKPMDLFYGPRLGAEAYSISSHIGHPELTEGSHCLRIETYGIEAYNKIKELCDAICEAEEDAEEGIIMYYPEPTID